MITIATNSTKDGFAGREHAERAPGAGHDHEQEECGKQDQDDRGRRWVDADAAHDRLERRVLLALGRIRSQAPT